MVLACAALAVVVAAGPEQPLPFSHKVHAGTMKLKCQSCHPNPDPGEMMTIKASDNCMQCHSAIKADSPSIQRLAAYVKNQRDIAWVRVYQIPGYVNFSHRSHLTGGITCEECHGQVAQQERVEKAADISMGGCMNCHRAKKVSIDCTFCHEQR